MTRARVVRLAFGVMLVAGCGAVSVGCDDRDEPPAVSINDATWRVELAVTPEQHGKGLAYRDSLPQDSGMLFIFPADKVRSFWMLGCRFGLDVAFLDADRRVVAVHTMYPQPGVAQEDLRLYSSVKPARYALEVGAGRLRQADVKVGDVAEFSPAVDLSR